MFFQIFILVSSHSYDYVKYFRSLGRVSLGHTIFISGLKCTASKRKKWWAHSYLMYITSNHLRKKIILKDYGVKLSGSFNTIFLSFKMLFTMAWCLLNLFSLIYSLMRFVLEYFWLDSLELAWFENGTGASFINLSCLPALINSSCLHKLFKLSDISNQTCYAQVRIMFLYNLNMYLTF